MTGSAAFLCAMPTAAKISARLDLVDKAITAILLTGQSYGIDGKTLTRADLPSLEEMEERLEQQLAEAQGGLIILQTEFDDPT